MLKENYFQLRLYTDFTSIKGKNKNIDKYIPRKKKNSTSCDALFGR